MRRARLAAAIGALLLPFACKCPSSDPKTVEPHMRPGQLERPRVLDTKQARRLKFQDKLKLTKQRPFLPPGVGPKRGLKPTSPQPGASQPVTHQTAAPAEGAAPTPAPEAAPAPAETKPPPATKANPTP